MRDENSRAKLIISILVVLVIILLIAVAYAFWIQPKYDDFILSKQQEAYGAGINDTQRAIFLGIRNSLGQLGYVQITFEDNQTVYLAPFNPEQVAQQQNVQQQSASEESAQGQTVPLI